MKVLKTKKVENCISGNNVFDALLDSPITYDFIMYLGKLGKLVYQDTFDKAYFNVIIRGKYTIKGAQGNSTVRLLMPTDTSSLLLEEFANYVEGFYEV